MHCYAIYFAECTCYILMYHEQPNLIEFGCTFSQFT